MSEQHGKSQDRSGVLILFGTLLAVLLLWSIGGEIRAVKERLDAVEFRLEHGERR